MNTVARGLGIRRGPVAGLRAAKDPATPTRTRSPIDAGDGRFGFLIGTGFWARFLREYDSRNGPGGLRAAGVMARGLQSTLVSGPFVRDLFEPTVASLTVNDDPPTHGSFTMIAAAVVPQVGLGFAPFRGVLDAPDKLHGLAFTSSPGRVALQLPRLFLGKAPSLPDWGGTVTRLQVDAETPIEWAIDGDVQAATAQLTLSCGPALEFCLP